MPPKFHTEDPEDLSRSTCGCVLPRVSGVAEPSRRGGGVREHREAAAGLERRSGLG